MRLRCIPATSLLTICLLIGCGSFAEGAPPIAVLSNVSPSGGQVGTTVSVTVAGSNLTDVTGLRCSLPETRVEPAGPNQLRLSIPADALPGQYDVQAITAGGLSSIRTFVVGNRPEQPEREPNQETASPQVVPLDVVVNGLIDRGDIDQFAFTARKGQRVLIDCQAERIDSRLRPVLELRDASGRRMAVNRGWWGTDPLVDFVVPTDGDYVVKLFDLVYSGGPEHFYRLSIDTGPRVAFTRPPVIERGKPTRVTLYGWNLSPMAPLSSVAGTPSVEVSPQSDHFNFESTTVELTPPAGSRLENLRLRSNQVGIDGFSYLHPGSDVPVLIGVTDVPVILDQPGHHSALTAYEVAVPVEVSGQLLAVDEQDWFAVTVRRGEVLFLETFGERIGSPVDLDVSVFDSSGERELATFHDDIRARESPQFRVGSSDPSGRWVAPADGRYLILIRSVTGDLDADPRRQYRLSIRREEPDFHLVAVPRHEDPLGINVRRGGSCVLDVLAFRQRGLTGPIRVTAKNLPVGMECPDIWLGPGVDSAPLVISVANQVAPFVGTLQLEGHADLAGMRPVRGGAMALKAPSGVASRITHEAPFSVAGDAPVKIVANGHEMKKHVLYGELQVRHSPGCILDVAVDVQRRDSGFQAPVRLMGIGLPELIANQTATIAAGQTRGTISFYLPPTLPVGKYTLAVQGETTVPTGPADASGKQKTEAITVASNTVVIDVQPAAFVITVDAFAPRQVRRGQTVQIPYAARRVNGFIGKIHTEPDAPGEIIGLRGRGVTFTGQSETGSIQFIASEDAPLGRQPFLRLYGIGALEDQPVYHGSCFLDLEIIE